MNILFFILFHYICSKIYKESLKLSNAIFIYFRISKIYSQRVRARNATKLTGSAENPTVK